LSRDQQGSGGLRGLAARGLRRGFQVAGVFWRHGFGPYLRGIGLARFLPSTPDGEPDPETAGLALPVRLRLACEEIGPVTIKVGQALASRPDLVPLEYAREFRRLQSSIPPFPFEQARQIIESDLHGSIEEMFVEFEEEPTASASIGQVHFAVLPDGQRVAVKVQRPRLHETVDTDLQILRYVARQAERHIAGTRDYRPSEWADEFARTLKAELDFTAEGRNMDRLRQSLADDDHVRVPRVHWALTSRQVLTLERMDGARIDDADAIADSATNRSAVAAHLAQSILRQLYVKGFFHADPHPGNVLVQQDGRIAFLDCGHTQSIGRDMREAMVRMLLAALDDDAIEVYDQIVDMGAVAEDTDLHQLRSDIQRVMSHYAGVSTAELRIGDVLEDIMGVIFRHKIRMPTVFASVVRALILTEGVCRELSPGFDFREPAQQVAREVLRDWARPTNLMREMWRVLRDLHRHSLLIPRQISELLGQTQAGGLQVKIEAQDREGLLHRLDVMFNRLAFALVVSAMIVGSSVILASEKGMDVLPTWLTVGYGLVGALMGGYLIYSIVISRRL